MHERAPSFRTPPEQISTQQLARYVQGWLVDGQANHLSPKTMEARRMVTDKLLWFLRQEEREHCGRVEIREFLAYLNTGHLQPDGRWRTGRPNDHLPVKARTTQLYFANLRVFFRWLVEEEALAVSPFDTLKQPINHQDQIQPYTEEQIQALLEAARQGRSPKRDEALIMFMLDSGCRAGEVCGLQIKDVDLAGRFCRVTGKGNRQRTVYIGSTTGRAMWQCIKLSDGEPFTPVFRAEHNRFAGHALTVNGLRQVVHRLGRKAGIESARCSPHTFRHTFAISFLRNGGNVFTLKELLGHSTLAICNKYVRLAQADMENQHRQFSPVDRLKRRR